MCEMIYTVKFCLIEGVSVGVCKENYDENYANIVQTNWNDGVWHDNNSWVRMLPGKAYLQP